MNSPNVGINQGDLDSNNQGVPNSNNGPTMGRPTMLHASSNGPNSNMMGGQNTATSLSGPNDNMQNNGGNMMGGGPNSSMMGQNMMGGMNNQGNHPNIMGQGMTRPPQHSGGNPAQFMPPNSGQMNNSGPVLNMLGAIIREAANTMTQSGVGFNRPPPNMMGNNGAPPNSMGLNMGASGMNNQCMGSNMNQGLHNMDSMGQGMNQNIGMPPNVSSGNMTLNMNSENLNQSSSMDNLKLDSTSPSEIIKNGGFPNFSIPPPDFHPIKTSVANPVDSSASSLSTQENMSVSDDVNDLSKKSVNDATMEEHTNDVEGGATEEDEKDLNDLDKLRQQLQAQIDDASDEEEVEEEVKEEVEENVVDKRKSLSPEKTEDSITQGEFEFFIS